MNLMIAKITAINPAPSKRINNPPINKTIKVIMNFPNLPNISLSPFYQYNIQMKYRIN